MTVGDSPEELEDQALVPDSVIGCSEVHQYDARLVAFLKAVFNVACQLHDLMDCAAAAAETSLLVGELGVNKGV